MICLLVVIFLLLQDKIIIHKRTAKKKQEDKSVAGLPGIMGQPKPVKRLVTSCNAGKSQNGKPVMEEDSFDPETEERGFDIEIPQEELDEVFGALPDLDEEEEEWRSFGAPNGEDGFATGVTFEELSTVGALLQQEALEPALQGQAVDIVHRIQGTELFSLLESSLGDASQKIARLLDQSMNKGMDSGSSTMRNGGLDDFDIGAFV